MRFTRRQRYDDYDQRYENDPGRYGLLGELLSDFKYVLLLILALAVALAAQALWSPVAGIIAVILLVIIVLTIWFGFIPS
jgi:steroid 5-alpha reductase family enzyme